MTMMVELEVDDVRDSIDDRRDCGGVGAILVVGIGGNEFW